MGRRAFTPTEEQRKQVFLWAKYGVPLTDMSKMIGISEPTLTKAFREEISSGKSFAHSKVRETLWEMATSGEYPAMTIFYCKTQLGMREIERPEGPQKIEIVGGLPD
jgi:hypothetical protein